jgi:hypothetical protein
VQPTGVSAQKFKKRPGKEHFDNTDERNIMIPLRYPKLFTPPNTRSATRIQHRGWDGFLRRCLFHVRDTANSVGSVKSKPAIPGIFEIAQY